MPPTLVLLLCTLLVLFLLAVEARASHGVSAAMWIPTIWMLISASRALADWFGMRGGNDSGSTPDRLVLSGLGLIGMLVLAGRRFDVMGILRRQVWLVALLAYMCVSTFWSDITLIALKRWAREWVVMVVAMVIISEANPRQALAALLRRVAYVLIPFSLVLIKYYPELGRSYGRWLGVEMWTGVTDQKNGLGRLCMISVFFLVFAFFQRRREGRKMGGRLLVWADIFILCVGAYLLKGCDSATSMATLCIGIAIFLSLQWLRKRRIRVPQTVLLALVIFLASYGISAPFLAA